MDKEVIKEIAIQLKEIGTSLKDLGAEGFTTYVQWFYKYNLAKVIISSASFVILGVSAYFLVRMAIKGIKEDTEVMTGVGITFGLFSIIAFISSFFVAISSLYNVIAPEYAALINLLGK